MPTKTYSVVCEQGCEQVIAASLVSQADADDIAGVLGASYYEEASQWECKPCRDARYGEAYQRWVGGESLAEMLSKAQREYEESVDALLERADSICDDARDRGRI